jgi:hypothetical protein
MAAFSMGLTAFQASAIWDKTADAGAPGFLAENSGKDDLTKAAKGEGGLPAAFFSALSLKKSIRP